MKRFKQYLMESLAQEREHTDPSMSTLKSLAKNSHYHEARFIIHHDGTLVAGDSNNHTHYSLSHLQDYHTAGYVIHEPKTDKYHYVAWHSSDAQHEYRPLEKFEKHGITRHPDKNWISNNDVMDEEFFKEMPMLSHEISKKSHRNIDPFEGPGLHLDTIGKLKGYEVQRAQVKGGHSAGYSLIHPPSGKTHMKVTGSEYDNNQGGADFKVGNLNGHPDSTVKAHEFYHHLITNYGKHGVTIHSDDIHSEGGMKTWKKLSEYPDVHITHHAPDGKEIPFHHGNDFERNYEDHGYGDHDFTYFSARKK